MAKRGSHEKHFTSGIGRAVDPGWADNFEGIIRDVLPSGVEFKMRERPGVVYVSGDDLYANNVVFEGNSKDQRRQHAEAYAQSLVRILSGEEGELDKHVALSDVTVPLLEEHRVALIHRRNGFRVGIRVEDKMSPAYPNEHIVQVEREIMEEEFDVPRTSESLSGAVPSHQLHLGQLVGDFDPQSIKDTGLLLQAEVPLSRIGIVEVGLRDY